MKIISKIYTYLIFIFLYFPIAVLVVFSFNNSKSRSVFNGFTFYWYKKLFENEQILNALSNTLIVAVIAAVVSTILGTIAVIGIMSMGKFIKRALMNITHIPMVNPEIVTGVSLMLLFVFLYDKFKILKPGMLTLILAHITFCLPYVILSIMPKFKSMNLSIYEAALDLGCVPVKAFFKVVLPQIMPGIITGMILAFTLSIDDFVISYFTSGTTATLPITIYSMTRKIVSPEINALSTILFAAVLILLIVVNVYKSCDEKRRKRQMKGTVK